MRAAVPGPCVAATGALFPWAFSRVPFMAKERNFDTSPMAAA